MFLSRRLVEALARMAEVAASPAAPTDALAFAKTVGLELANAARNAVGMDETKMRAPATECAAALEMCTIHETDPSLG